MIADSKFDSCCYGLRNFPHRLALMSTMIFEHVGLSLVTLEVFSLRQFGLDAPALCAGVVALSVYVRLLSLWSTQGLVLLPGSALLSTRLDERP